MSIFHEDQKHTLKERSRRITMNKDRRVARRTNPNCTRESRGDGSCSQSFAGSRQTAVPSCGTWPHLARSHLHLAGSRRCSPDITSFWLNLSSPPLDLASVREKRWRRESSGENLKTYVPCHRIDSRQPRLKVGKRPAT